MSRSFVAFGLILAACSPKPYGPENDWYHANEKDLPEDLAGTGIAVGDTLENFTFADQHGNEVELYQFYGQVVQLVLMTQWCPPCQEEAPTIEAASVSVAEKGLQVVEIMLENKYGEFPASADCDEWATEYGATHPIVADPADTHGPMINGGYPTLPILDRELKVAAIDNYPFDPGVLEALAAEGAEDEGDDDASSLPNGF